LRSFDTADDLIVVHPEPVLPGIQDFLFRGNDTDGCFVEFVSTLENRYNSLA
jgi:hypothetical protein